MKKNIFLLSIGNIFWEVDCLFGYWIFIHLGKTILIMPHGVFTCQETLLRYASVIQLFCLIIPLYVIGV